MHFTFPNCGNPAVLEAKTGRVCKLWKRNKKEAEKRPIPYRSRWRIDNPKRTQEPASSFMHISPRICSVFPLDLQSKACNGRHDSLLLPLVSRKAAPVSSRQLSRRELNTCRRTIDALRDFSAFGCVEIDRACSISSHGMMRAVQCWMQGGSLLSIYKTGNLGRAYECTPLIQDLSLVLIKGRFELSSCQLFCQNGRKWQMHKCWIKARLYE